MLLQIVQYICNIQPLQIVQYICNIQLLQKRERTDNIGPENGGGVVLRVCSKAVYTSMQSGVSELGLQQKTVSVYPSVTLK